ncbi:hypothetical protein LUW75_22440 [Streptomyces sp. MRC013]|uniref:hypothetical protein n=1 Tax=Streptomyces sp. MRC013 TaxID=2898276 RepID=UPI002026C864|nr:hypothetical protein [Streptomyces sp. MRC013]URM92256.1 hypothetical protein LUW75_22440 [Streptomyces sp. MRC013]
MLTYHEVMTTDLELLTRAAAKWESMAAELKKVETRYGESVQKVAMGRSWVGLSAGVAQTSFSATRYEYSAAQAQARAIASLLRDAHEKFTDLKKKLESIRDDAIAAGMTVSEQGFIAFDSSKLTDGERNAYHHDPEYQSSVQAAVGKWQKLIEDRVKAVDETDQHVKATLSAAVVDSNKDAFGRGSGKDATLNGFNAYAEGDLDKAPKTLPAEEAKDGTKTSGATVTGPDVGFTVSGVKYGKEGSVKAYADLFHATAKGEGTHGRLALSGIDEMYAGARATGNLGFTDEGFVAKGEASVGARSLVEGRAEYGHVGGYGRLEGFAGAEAGVTAKATKEEVTVKAKAFAGGKASAAGGVEAAGIGVGLTGEGWVGPGAETWFGYKKDEETGQYKLGGKAGISPGLGGAVGLEITFDPNKFSKAVEDAADFVGRLTD